MDLEGRIFRAYYKRFSDSPIPEHHIEYYGDNEEYAVLQNINGILAVYRIREDGSLKFINPMWFVYRWKQFGFPECPNLGFLIGRLRTRNHR